VQVLSGTHELLPLRGEIAEGRLLATLQAKADGYDKMKVCSFLNKESYDAVIATAKEQHMDVIGHIPYALSVENVEPRRRFPANISVNPRRRAPSNSASEPIYFWSMELRLKISRRRRRLPAS
jgi:hypothetical protein